MTWNIIAGIAIGYLAGTLASHATTAARERIRANIWGEYAPIHVTTRHSYRR